MYSHSKRWEKAQELEKIYWQKEYFRDSEYKELILKYEGIFKSIEEKYGFNQDTKILDLGCGATCPSTLFANGIKYGVDPLVDEFIEKDKEKLDGKIALKKGGGEDIPFEDNFFDVCLCRNAIDHMDNLDKVMQEIKRVTIPNGIAIFSVYTYTPFITFLKKTSECIPFLRNIEHPFTFTPEGFKRFCSEHFEVIDEMVVFEGKNSIDYGKQDVEMTEPVLNRVFVFFNRYIFMNIWFVREFLLVCRAK